jgi:hypothetical protein
MPPHPVLGASGGGALRREELVADLAPIEPPAMDDTGEVPPAVLLKSGFRAIAVIFEN